MIGASFDKYCGAGDGTRAFFGEYNTAYVFDLLFFINISLPNRAFQ